jgi:hypothetical protein
MTEALEAATAYSVYGKQTPRGLRVCWSGAVDNVQFDIMRRDGCVLVAFAGTNEVRDMWRHLLVRRETIGDGIKVHRGWLADFQKCIPVIYCRPAANRCKNLSTRVVFLGHSVRRRIGADSRMVSYAHEYGMRLALALRTYGSPRAGNAGFAKDLDRRVRQSHYRYVAKGDPVTQTPLAFRYRHGGTQILNALSQAPRILWRAISKQ